MDRTIIGSGVEKSISYQLSEAFVVKAKDNGKVESVDEETGLMTVLYESGKQDIFERYYW